MKKRSKHEKIEGIQRALEAHRRFDVDYIPFLGTWQEPDGNYPYRQKGWDFFWTTVGRVFLFLFGRPFTFLCFGAKVVGKQNLRAIGKSGAVCICNHFNYVDTLFVRQAVGYFRSYHTMDARNNKRGFGGWILRHGAMLPFSSDHAAARRLNDEIGRLLASGKILNFYAEQSLWTNYQKPRPMKSGAFHYAVKHAVPVLPVFCTFRKNKRGHIRKVRIHILPAVYPDENLPRKDRIGQMKEEAEREWKECYEKAYGIPLTYLGSFGQ